MTTCPRCGRVADDEIVCPNCGMSLALARLSAAQSAPGLMDDLGAEAGAEVAAEEGADESEGSSRDVKMWRLAALVCLTCLLAATTAIVLLNQHGSDNTPF